MATIRDDLITLASMAVMLFCLCVCSSQGEDFLKWGTGFVAEKQAGTPLAALLAAPFRDGPCATLCTVNAFPFPIKIDQHDQY